MTRRPVGAGSLAGAVRRLVWFVRLALVVAVAGLGLAAVTVGRDSRGRRDPERSRPGPGGAAWVHRSGPALVRLRRRRQRDRPLPAGEQPADRRSTRCPTSVRQAFVAVEDAEFPRHHGVNIRSLVRALLTNVQGTSSRQGASTITQQVVKLEYLSGLERDARYKILQARYAILLEKKLDKDQILERYLNTVFFGNNAYGIQAAAEVYFGKQVKDLDLIEGAFLAGLVRSPSNYEPINHPERSRARFRQVMDRIGDVGLLTKVETDELASSWELPEKRLSATRAADDPDPLHRSGEGLSPQRLDRARRHRARALQRAVPRRAADLHHPRPPAAAAGRRRQDGAAPGERAAASRRRSCRSTAPRARCGRWSAGPEFKQGVNEVNLALRPRQTGSAHQDLHPGRSGPGRRPAHRHHRRHAPVHAPEPRRSEGSVQDHVRRHQGAGRRCRR